MVHPWCQDVPRDEAVRAAEDAAASERPPLPEWRDLPERVARLEALLSRSGKNAPSDGDSDAKCTERESSADAEPVADAWGVVRDGEVESVSHRRFRESADNAARDWGGTVVPLYRAPPPPRGWLTRDEIAVCVGLRDYCRSTWETWGRKDNLWRDRAAALDALLSRNSPPRVRLPGDSLTVGGVRMFRQKDVIKALAAAGVEVSE